MTTKIQPSIEYKKGDRLNFVWSRPYDGVTPGTVVYANPRIVEVKWDDGKRTRTNPMFLSNNTTKIEVQ